MSVISFVKRTSVLLGVLGVSVGCDQATKHLATASLAGHQQQSFLGDLFRLTYAMNDGAFLSLGANLSSGARFWVLTVGVGLLLAGLLAYAMFGRKLNAFQVGGYALIAGGGLSNWFDRARNGGAVVDFMNMGFGQQPWQRTGIFNVADVAILVGIGVLLLVKEKKPTPALPPQTTP
ncbi:MAG: signal peptidase II [Myxococcaceae bacterium]